MYPLDVSLSNAAIKSASYFIAPIVRIFCERLLIVGAEIDMTML
jgi:hypothetical protein